MTLGPKRKMSSPGVEPGLSRPQRDVLTTRRWGLDFLYEKHRFQNTIRFQCQTWASVQTAWWMKSNEHTCCEPKEVRAPTLLPNPFHVPILDVLLCFSNKQKATARSKPWICIRHTRHGKKSCCSDALLCFSLAVFGFGWSSLTALSLLCFSVVAFLAALLFSAKFWNAKCTVCER